MQTFFRDGDDWFASMLVDGKLALIISWYCD